MNHQHLKINKMKKLFILPLLAIFSCSPAEFETYEPHTPAEPVSSVIEPVNELGLPLWIRGNFRSRLIPTETVDVSITEYDMVFDFSSFNVPILDFGVEDVEYSILEEQVTIYCSDTESIILRKHSDPNNTDIHVSYINNSHIYVYGLFQKI